MGMRSAKRPEPSKTLRGRSAQTHLDLGLLDAYFLWAALKCHLLFMKKDERRQKKAYQTSTPIVRHKQRTRFRFEDLTGKIRISRPRPAIVIDSAKKIFVQSNKERRSFSASGRFFFHKPCAFWEICLQQGRFTRQRKRNRAFDVNSRKAFVLIRARLH